MDRTADAAGLGDIGTLAAPSRLSRRLDGSESGHPDAERAFQRARQLFLAGERIDMGELATELGVDRTSLFRWVGNRDALLSEVLWSLAVPTLNNLDAAISSRGAQRLTEILTGFVDALINAEYFQWFLRREPARALRLLTTMQSEMQRRFVAIVEFLVTSEIEGGYLTLPLPPHELASLLVRMVESFSYADIITGEQPSTERARAAFEFVLRA
jgi:AcrR family transcriptional regulator